MTSSSSTRICVAAVAALLVLSTAANGFTALQGTSTNRFVAGKAPLNSAPLTLLRSSRRDDDFPREEREEEYTGSIDWDAEWKKVVEKERSGQSIDRPGKDFYKSDAELAAIRAAKKAKAATEKVSQSLPSLPSMNSLTGDWRFWIGILAIISVGSAVLSAQPSYTPTSSGDSFYI